MEGLTGIEKLKAIEEIKLLKARRDRAADTKDWALYEALHAPDHVSENGDYETGELLILGFGFYHETCQIIGGKWLFTSRQLKRTHVRERPEARD